jgi:lipooligosaccharide transport system ATP-binding protein
MRRRLLIARALVNRPELLVLDEPTTGLDPQARRAVWELLQQLRDRGVTLLLTTHYMEEAERVCDRLVIMDFGRIVAEGSPAELLRRYGQQTLEGVFLEITGHALRE